MAASLDQSVGLGVDVVEIARMQAILERNSSFVARVFSEAERSYCDNTPKPAVHYATRFAAKEAVLKALGTGFSQGIEPWQVEIARRASGRPYVVLHDAAKEAALALGVVEIPLSLSYTHQEAVACALAITKQSRDAQASYRSMPAKLSAQFKEARSILDELDEQQLAKHQYGEQKSAE